jgi:uncharacterized YigZ family protein
MPSHATLVGEVDVEIDKIKASRFWAFARPVSDEAEARAFVEELRRLHRSAGHHCHAWRLGIEEARTRCSDDGEPGGTAGRPILREIEARGLRDVCVVVLRWFGGTKLGTGGLVRAYGAAARAVLADAPTRVIRLTQSARLRFAYPDTALVEAVLRDRALRPLEADYGADVTFSLEVQPEDLQDLERALADATAGRVRLELEA